MEFLLKVLKMSSCNSYSLDSNVGKDRASTAPSRPIGELVMGKVSKFA